MTYYTNDAEITASFIEERGQHEKSESYDIYKEVLDIDSPTSFLSDLSFTRYATVVLWITTVVTGLGAEAIVGTAMSEFAAGGGSKSKIGWNFAQLVFSLFALVSLFSRSVFGLPFLVVGLYKCGYPETLGFLLHGRCSYASGAARREASFCFLLRDFVADRHRSPSLRFLPTPFSSGEHRSGEPHVDLVLFAGHGGAHSPRGGRVRSL
jgi:hypothetical protein